MRMENSKFENNAFTPEEAISLFQDSFKNTFTDYLGVELLKYEHGYCYTKLSIKPEFTNPIGGLHGGLLYTLADTTAGVAAVYLGSGNAVTTVNGDMQFLRPALHLDTIFAEAKVIKDGKRLVFLDVLILTEDGTVLAKGSFIFARIPVPSVNTDE